jgi:hypothetical protein
MLLDLRQDAWDKAEQTSKNLLQVLERDIARNIELYDLSLRGVSDNLKAPGLTQVSPELRQLVLFDRAATARDMGVMVVTDEKGDSILEADRPPQGNPRVKLVRGRPGVDPVCGPRPMQVFGL